MARVPDEVQPGRYDGTAGNDLIVDHEEPYVGYWGYGGNDTFIASPTDYFSKHPFYTPDYFYGGSGDDTVTYFLSNKSIMANLGTGVVHRMFGGMAQSSDYLDSIENLVGSVYSDSIVGSNGANKLWGHGGNDQIWAQDGNDQARGDSGNDTVNGGVGHDSLWGGTGNDELNGDGGNDQLRGDDGADTLSGGSNNDVLWGGAHADALNGDSGDDRLEGGTGNDAIDGGSGTDTVVYTGNGAVQVNLWLGTASGAMGNDSLTGIERVETGNGNDVVFGDAGNNRLLTGGGNDVVYGLAGIDWIEAGSGNDTVYGYEGSDAIFGGTGADEIWGGEDGDVLKGENGNDRISGDAGNDELWGGANNDVLRGGAGIDTIVTGSGADIVRWEDGDTGTDVITDFSLANDHFSFKEGFFAVEPVGAVDLEDVLTAWNAGGGNTLLAANTASDGWLFIAELEGVNAIALGARIADESILAVQVADIGGGAPDGFEFG